MNKVKIVKILQSAIRSQAPKVANDKTMEKVQRLDGNRSTMMGINHPELA